MGTLRKIKRGKQQAPPSFNQKALLEIAHTRGFDDGAEAQRQADIEYVVNLMEELETVPGVGKVTADKIREYFTSKLLINTKVLEGGS